MSTRLEIEGLRRFRAGALGGLGLALTVAALPWICSCGEAATPPPRPPPSASGGGGGAVEEPAEAPETDVPTVPARANLTLESESHSGLRLVAAQRLSDGWLLIGEADAGVDLDLGPGSLAMATKGGFVARVGPDLRPRWRRLYPGVEILRANAFRADAVAVTGRNSVSPESYEGQAWAAVIGLDGSERLRWSAPPPERSLSLGVAFAPEGGLYLGVAFAAPPSSPSERRERTPLTPYLVRLSATGEVLWRVAHDPAEGEAEGGLSFLTPAPDGGVVLFGNGDGSFAYGSLRREVIFARPPPDRGDRAVPFQAYWVRVSASGEVIALSSFEGRGGISMPMDATFGPGGELYIGGYFRRQVDLDPGPGRAPLRSAWRDDQAFLARIEADGSLGASRTWSGTYGVQRLAVRGGRLRVRLQTREGDFDLGSGALHLSQFEEVEIELGLGLEPDTAGRSALRFPDVREEGYARVRCSQEPIGEIGRSLLAFDVPLSVCLGGELRREPLSPF